MAEKKVWLGSVGPYLYDDEETPFALETDGVFKGDVEGLATPAAHAPSHLPAGSDSLPTKEVTVVTAVDFTAETVTTEVITVLDV